MNNTEDKRKWFEITSAGLHIIAMALMLCDHLWANFFLSQRWMTSLGRLAFPIFAFMIAEGFFKTSSRWKYIRRMAIFAVITELPFNLGIEHSLIYPYHQNVLFTFVLGMLGMMLIEKTRTWLEKKLTNAFEKDNRKNNGKLAADILTVVLTVLVSVIVTMVFFLIGLVTFVDYYGSGVQVVLLFYLCHPDNINNLVGRFFADETKKSKAYGICVKIVSMVLQVYLLYQAFSALGGFCYMINIFGYEFEIVEELLAMLALPIIWLYRGRKGYNAKWFKYFNYVFYPAHLFIIYLLTLVVGALK